MTTGTLDPVTVPDETTAPPRTRQAMSVLALIGTLIAAYMGLYTVGVIEQVACGTGACESVQASPWSVFLGIPVPFWGVAGYGLILALCLMGLQPRYQDSRFVSLALLATCTWAAGFSAYLSYAEAVWIQAWCRWCVASAIVAALLFLLSLAEIPRLRRG